MKRKDNEEPGLKDLWIAPRYSLKGGERAWESRHGGPSNSSRFLELADIALGIKKPTPRKRKLGEPLPAQEKQKPGPRSSK
jgi:hypothetical protein